MAERSGRKDSHIMRSWKHRLVFILASGVACGSGSNGTPLAAQEPPAGALPPLSRTFADQRDVFHGPILSVGEAIPRLPSEELTAADRPLPINLATALQLAGARPTIIAAAQASVGVAQAQLSKANVLWLPSLSVGAGYYRHDEARPRASPGPFTTTPRTSSSRVLALRQRWRQRTPCSLPLRPGRSFDRG